ncbi:hypothetical protein [Parasitella parasitica]|uniref:Uncharacterized protein n=1 Tax=Parasitella parasitica TaxID=35722 RepID=A0A0B7NLZ6_9FUNG|nr:hypothetical protein [Parasitella parasitica]
MLQLALEQDGNPLEIAEGSFVIPTVCTNGQALNLVFSTVPTSRPTTPRPHAKLAPNFRVSVSPRFIKNENVLEVLSQTHVLSTAGLSFKGKTGNKVIVDSNVTYEVVLDEVPAITMTLQANCTKYLESNTNASTEALVETRSASVVPVRVLEETVEPDTEEESDDDLDLV